MNARATAITNPRRSGWGFEQEAKFRSLVNGTLLSGTRWFFPSDSSNTPLKYSLDQIPNSSTPMVTHEYRQHLNIQSSALPFSGALNEYGRPPLRALGENARGAGWQRGKKRRLE